MFVLDLDRLRQVDAHGGDNMFSLAWGDRLRWRVCPECLWLTISYDPQLVCGRKASDPVAYGGRFDNSGTSYTCVNQALTLVPVQLADAMWGALRLGGVNAVVEIVSNLRPEEMGLLSNIEKARERSKVDGKLFRGK